MALKTRIISFSSAVTSLVLLFGVYGCGPNQGETGEPQSHNEKISYSIGFDIGKNFKKQEIDSLTPGQILHGLRDGMEGKDPVIPQEEMTSLIKQFQEEVMSKRSERQKKQATDNRKKTDEFLKKNKKKEDIKVTASGLQYKILEEGEGPSPTENDTVVVHYTGKLLDGTVFDSSRKRGEPATFPVNGVIKGWTEALQMMHEGAKWKLFVPPELAYGKRNAPGPIGPNDLLIFDVELIEVKR